MKHNDNNPDNIMSIEKFLAGGHNSTNVLEGQLRC